MRNLFLGPAIAAAFLTLAAGAAEPAPSKPAPAADGSRVSCFSEKVTGSNLRRKVCMTEAQREQRRLDDQAAVNELKNRSSAPGKNNSGQGAYR